MITLNIYRVTTTADKTVYVVAETHSRAFAKVESARRSDFVKPFNY
jgi:hypothetical protein